MLPRRLGPADDREIRLHALAVADGRLDVPVLELGVAVAADDRDGLRPERLESYDAVERRVDGRAVGARDVDSEVEAAAHAVRRHPDARVAEEPAHGVLRVERLDRPAVGGRPRSPPRRPPVRADGTRSVAATAMPAAIARGRFLRTPSVVAMRPRSDRPQTGRPRRESRPANGARPSCERSIRTWWERVVQTPLNAGVPDPRPARGEERGGPDRPRGAATARPPGRPASARRARRADRAARRRALRRRSAADRDRVAAERGRRAPEGARPGRPRHAAAGVRPGGVGRAGRRAALRAAARRREGRLTGGAPSAPRARARPLAWPGARRVRLRGLGADRGTAARRAPARRRRGADRDRHRARSPRRRRPGARVARPASTRCASGPASSSCARSTRRAARPTRSAPTTRTGRRSTSSASSRARRSGGSRRRSSDTRPG